MKAITLVIEVILAEKIKKLLFTFLFLFIAISSSARNFSWVNADYAEDYSWWVFVYEDINVPEFKYKPYKVWVQWEFVTPEAKKKFETKAKIEKSLYEISYDLSQYRILQVTGYDENGNTISISHVPSSRSYFIPGTIGEKIVNTVKIILSSGKKSPKKNGL